MPSRRHNNPNKYNQSNKELYMTQQQTIGLNKIFDLFNIGTNQVFWAYVSDIIILHKFSHRSRV